MRHTHHHHWAYCPLEHIFQQGSHIEVFWCIENVRHKILGNVLERPGFNHFSLFWLKFFEDIPKLGQRHVTCQIHPIIDLRHACQQNSVFAHQPVEKCLVDKWVLRGHPLNDMPVDSINHRLSQVCVLLVFISDFWIAVSIITVD